MKLLLDQNLSPRLVHRLADIYPNSTHVAEVGLDRSFDREVWEYARQHDYIIVTKEAEAVVLREQSPIGLKSGYLQGVSTSLALACVPDASASG